MLTQERLKELLHYDPNTGLFTRLITTSQNARKGYIAGSLGKRGYVIIWIDGCRYAAHILAWLYIHGVFPKEQIDHKNRIKYDNSLLNLRLATHAQNVANRLLLKSNSSGYHGVTWDSINKKWRAQLRFNHCSINIGRFDNIEDAAFAAQITRMKLLGEFAP